MLAKKERMLDAAKGGGAAEGVLAGASASEVGTRHSFTSPNPIPYPNPQPLP